MYPSITTSGKELAELTIIGFEFLIVSLLEAFLEMLNEMDYKTLSEAPMFKGVIHHYNQSGVIDIVAEVLKQGKYEDLIDDTEKELEDGKCPQHQKPLEYITEKNYYFRMGKYQQQLIDAIKKENHTLNSAVGSEENMEAITAFLEKRKPDFSRF